MDDHDADALATLRYELQKELTERLLPYWMEHTLDEQHGGFVGQITHQGTIVAEAPKGAVLNARILWTFSAAYRALDDETYRQVAGRAYSYFNQYFWDAEHEGVFWTIDHRGQPLSTRKQTYAQAFALYGMAEYFRATGDTNALIRALRLFRLIEEHTYDPEHGGYFEALSRDWGALDDVRLSEKDLNAPKSMNTLLHVLEAYTTLYSAWPDPLLKDRLTALTKCFLATVLDPQTYHLHLFFDADWSLQSKTVSFGHDIEASWLLVEAADVLGKAALREHARAAAVEIARVTLEQGQDRDGGLFYEAHPGAGIDTDKHWWPQAEAIVGFLNAYQETGDQDFLQAAVAAWGFIKQHILDHDGGEWFGRVAQDGQPYDDEDKVGLWKCPYHNARAGLEVMARVAEIGVASS